MRMGEQVGGQHNKVDYQHTNGRTQELLHEGSGRFVHGPGHYQVLCKGYGTKVECHEGHGRQPLPGLEIHYGE